MIKLRAHHLLCISRFNKNNSSWYSKNYEKNFKKVLGLIKKSKDKNKNS